ncbi:MAG: Glu-tRNA(Gln) amidotransferase subunit GatE [Candidatus Aenigmatarchaeota archaeon]
MSYIDFKKLGLKVGIEIHQRLDTKKLFCSCKSDQKEESYKSIYRKMRPVKGEMGEIDPAAVHEYLKGKEFKYKIYPNESCLVETDSEPPHGLNKNSLNLTLQIAKLLDCDIVDEVHIMRKTVVDGSNTGGFQRTGIVGIDGSLKMDFGQVKIETLCLEEEAARIEDRKGGQVTYKLNGLGIPLVEVATDASMSTPNQGQKVAKRIGKLLRSTEVQRGIGSIRQDVNVSIENGARVEIKGFQELKEMSNLIENEVKRQKDLLKIKNKLNAKNMKKGEIKEVTNYFEDTECKFIKKIVENGSKVFAGILKNFSGLMNHSCGAHHLGKELSQYAIPFGPKGIIHEEEDLEKYKLSEEFRKIRKDMKVGKNDIIFITAGSGSKEAVKAVIKRGEKCFEGVPEETRVANGTDSKFTRPLPGSGRMYPETDIEPVEIDEKKKEDIEIPETLEKLKNRFVEKFNLTEGRAEELIDSNYSDLFQSMTNEVDTKPKKIAEILTSYLKDAKSREGATIERIKEKQLENLIKKFDKGEIVEDSLVEVIYKLASGKDIDEILKERGKLSKEDLKKIIDGQIKENKKMIENEGKRAFKKLMGPVMGQVRGKIDGDIVAKVLKERLDKFLG